MVISLIDVPAKNAKPLKPLLEGSGGRVREHMNDRQSAA